MYEENQKIAEQHGFAFAACMICAHKQGHPVSQHCQQCFEQDKKNENETPH